MYWPMKLFARDSDKNKRESDYKMEIGIELSIIVPCLNEQESIPLFYEELIKVLTKMDITYEIIFIDDGSKDATLQKMK